MYSDRQYTLAPSERDYVDSVKQQGRFEQRGQCRVKRRLHAIAVAEMANERGGIEMCDPLSGNVYQISPGTPWDEVLPVPDEEMAK